STPATSWNPRLHSRRSHVQSTGATPCGTRPTLSPSPFPRNLGVHRVSTVESREHIPGGKENRRNRLVNRQGDLSVPGRSLPGRHLQGDAPKAPLPKVAQDERGGARTVHP